jgi:CrcB protein
MTILWTQCLGVAAGGAIGAVLRFLVSQLCARQFGTAFPLGTLLINVSGSLLLGWFLTVTRQRYPVTESFHLAVAVGLVGAFTTFSTFAWETDVLLKGGAEWKALANIVGSVLLGLAAVRLGVFLGQR